MPLRSDVQTQEVEDAIVAAAERHRKTRVLEQHRSVYEHGHWWLIADDPVEDNVVVFDVVDAEGGESVDGFDFELLP